MYISKTLFSFKRNDTCRVNEVVSHLDRSYPWNSYMVTVCIWFTTHHLDYLILPFPCIMSFIYIKIKKKSFSVLTTFVHIKTGRKVSARWLHCHDSLGAQVSTLCGREKARLGTVVLLYVVFVVFQRHLDFSVHLQITFFFFKKPISTLINLTSSI